MKTLLMVYSQLSVDFIDMPCKKILSNQMESPLLYQIEYMYQLYTKDLKDS